VNLHTISRLPSAPYVIDRAIYGRRSTVPTYELGDKVVAALWDAGWRLVPGRAPTPRGHETANPPLVEGEITVRQLIDMSALFDELDEELFTASDFIAWMAPDVRGSAEFRWLEKRRLG